ncbi:glutamyl-tRNA synthetase [Kiloniella litopenaei]|uniref:Glutamate--tRNA ligase n=1 Tax=Kiloniella litopenaei TaxID=1549748 RepID=A0A0M2R676_9PROT|nr:glutamate--tRNA ligase [Kiloniella litopenaei]KKJ75515.1 glutamyl-tRNA synthetase [Kiloniella litopenaei]
MSHPTKQVVTRFAPSPTGFLHIGGARTALFNWLFAKHHGGKYLLRIEDTDRKRSTPEAIEAIIDGLDWLGLKHDDEITYQFARAERHQQVAQKLLSEGKAYYCYCSPEELTEMRETARAEGRPMKYDGRWRDRPASDAPEGVKPVVRLKMPQEGETLIKDLVQGDVTVANSQLDDMVLLRADGTPTYMLSVVVDDHDMGITHIIRGDDHLTNAFRQTQLFKAMDWELPNFAHIPLIHGADGAKLSKRHGALGVEAYRDEMGYLPEALRNYLLRLGWGHGDEEVISTEQAIKWFDIDGVGKSPSRFDFAKLENLNGIYIRNSDDSYLANIISPLICEKEGVTVSAGQKAVLIKGMSGLKERAKTIIDLAESAAFYVKSRPLQLNDKAKKLLSDEGKENLKNLLPALQNLATWEENLLENTVKSFAEENELKLGKVAQPLRAALSGSNVSPGIFEVMAILGKDESINRITDQI